jgi:hypothetical protein
MQEIRLGLMQQIEQDSGKKVNGGTQEIEEDTGNEGRTKTRR